MPYSNCPFSFWDLNKDFSFLGGKFKTVGEFLPSRSEAEKLAGSEKNKIFAYQTLF